MLENARGLAVLLLKGVLGERSNVIAIGEAQTVAILNYA